MAKRRILACPHCGCDDLSQMRYEEEVIAYRNVRLVDGNMVVMEERYEIDDGGDEAHFHCHQCRKDFSIPSWAELEFDDSYEPDDEEVT